MKEQKGRCVGSNTSACWASLPTGNLFSFSALSLVAECPGIFFNGFVHLRPEDGFLFQRFFT